MIKPSRKILAFTGCRSDYDLLSGLFKKLKEDQEFDFSLLVSGAHLDPEHGETVRNIEADGIPISARIPTISKSEYETRLVSAGNLFQGALRAVSESRPDLLLYAGDREDVIVAALIGAYLNIPTAHFFGGDHSNDGHVDHKVRHATSKLSGLHFVSMEEHRDRLLAIGEDQKHIHVIGSPALDKFLDEPALEVSSIFEKLGVKPPQEFAILIYHPMEENGMTTGECFNNILDVLAAKKLFTIVSYPNIDHGHQEILEVISRFSGHSNFHFTYNLPRNHFINLLRNAKCLVGNSSAGIIEGPLLRLPVINVGNRQVGRATSHNVVFCDGSPDSIRNAFVITESTSYKNSISSVLSLYGDGHSSEKAYQILKQIHFPDLLIKSLDPLQRQV